MQKQHGLFTREEVVNVPHQSGVYFVFNDKEFPRLKGKTKIVYIGTATNLYKRLTGRRNALPRFTTLRKNGFSLTFKFYTTKTREEARELEAKKLKIFERNHLELPPLNHAN